MIADAPPRTKVSLEWHKDDLLKVWGSQIGEGPVYKSIEMPISDYAQIQRDAVHSVDGKLVGVSTHGGYTVNEKEAVSLGVIDVEFAEPGTELVITWGEPDGGSAKAGVERHEQTTIRATVCPIPYAKAVRELKHQTTNAETR
jgi:vanillate/3-O-methylgallate O-demethylase